MKLKYCCYNKKTTFLIAQFGVLLGISGLPQSASAQSESSHQVVTVPNLLHHSIPSHDSADSRYAVSVDEFKNQMKQLKYWGYSRITIKQLVDYIKSEPREVQGDTDLEAFADLLPWTNHYVPAPRRKYILQ
jgi:hypothetical protein